MKGKVLTLLPNHNPLFLVLQTFRMDSQVSRKVQELCGVGREQRVLFVGPSHAGKTTLICSILRMFDGNEGRAFCDNTGSFPKDNPTSWFVRKFQLPGTKCWALFDTPDMGFEHPVEEWLAFHDLIFRGCPENVQLIAGSVPGPIKSEMIEQIVSVPANIPSILVIVVNGRDLLKFVPSKFIGSMWPSVELKPFTELSRVTEFVSKFSTSFREKLGSTALLCVTQADSSVLSVKQEIMKLFRTSDGNTLFVETYENGLERPTRDRSLQALAVLQRGFEFEAANVVSDLREVKRRQADMKESERETKRQVSQPQTLAQQQQVAQQHLQQRPFPQQALVQEMQPTGPAPGPAPSGNT